MIPKPITIEPILNGFVCQVGCQRVAFNSRETLLHHLGEYLRNPEQVEKNFIANAVNRMMEGPPPHPPQTQIGIDGAAACNGPVTLTADDGRIPRRQY